MSGKNFWITLWSIFLMQSIYPNTPLLFIDTGNHDEILFNTAFAVLKDAGYSPIFKTAFELYPEDLNHYQSFIIYLDAAFYGASARDLSMLNKIENPALKHVYQLLDAIQNKQNAFIGLIIPITSNPVLIRSMSEQLISKLFGSSMMNLQTQQTLQQFLTHILQSDASKSKQYATALLTERKKEESTAKVTLPPCNSSCTYLPHNTKVPAELEPLLPLGFMIKNPQKNNNYFITNSSAFGMFDLKEPFILTPFHLPLRTHAYNAFAQTLMQAVAWHQNKPMSTMAKDHLTTPCKKELYHERFFKITNPIYDWIKKEGIVCSWLGIDPYKGKEDQAVQDIVNSKTNVMWFELNPEVYLTEHSLAKAQKESFFKNIEQFTAAMKRFKTNHPEKPLPHFFVGTDITTNFAQHKVTDHAIDMFGYAYDKIPSPLDIAHFWKPELLDVIDRFADEWNDRIGNGIPLAGVFLDLEMYHAQKQTGQFHATMDFSNTAWNLFADAQQDCSLKQIINLNERIQYLLTHKLMNSYFFVLRQRAKEIGMLIKEHIRKKLPQALIAVYNINPSFHWFYQGLYQGLSSTQEPLICCTFNMGFLPHDRALRKNGIHLLHAPVLLLSKLQKPNDFNIISELYNQHDGIWINRFSRLAESRDKKDWGWDWGVETTPLDTQTVVTSIAAAVADAQNNCK